MSPEEKTAYSRGYSRGRRWPLHRPPEPPSAIVARLLRALQRIRDEADAYLATLDEGDELQTTLGAGVDDADEALAEFGGWVADAPPSAASDASLWLVQRRAAARKASKAYYDRNREKDLAARRRRYGEQREAARSNVTGPGPAEQRARPDEKGNS